METKKNNGGDQQPVNKQSKYMIMPTEELKKDQVQDEELKKNRRKRFMTMRNQNRL